MTAPSVIEDRGQLVSVLHEVAEIEHTVMCQYLTAAFTVKRAGEAGISAAQAERARRAQANVLKVARQEMEHLALVNNLLVAIGAQPHFWRPNFPVRYRYFPLDLAFSLQPLGLASLARFVCFERPDDWERGECGFDPSKLCAEQKMSPEVRASVGPPRGRGPGGQGPVFETVEDILLAVRDAVNNVGHHPGLEDLFIGHPQKEPVKNFALGFAMNIFEFTVSGPRTASAALDLMLLQGEGARAQPGFMTHFCTFCAIYKDLEREPFELAWDMVENPRAQNVTDAYARDLTAAFSFSYVTLLYMLVSWYTYFRPERAQPAGFSAALQQMAIGPMMTMVLRPIGELLVRSPAGTAGGNAGPNWDIPEADAALAPTDDPLFFMSRLEHMSELLVTAYGHGRDQAQLRYILETMARLAVDFARISGLAVDDRALFGRVPGATEAGQ